MILCEAVLFSPFSDQDSLLKSTDSIQEIITIIHTKKWYFLYVILNDVLSTDYSWVSAFKLGSCSRQTFNIFSPIK